MPAGGSRKNSPHKACEGKGCERCNNTGKAPVGNKKLKPEQPILPETPKTDEAPKKDLATTILAGLGKPNGHKAECEHKEKCECRCKCEECLWKRDAEDEGATGRWTRDRLWSRRNGNPVSIVNHLHDKPIEHNVTVTLAETIQKARKRASQR